MSDILTALIVLLGITLALLGSALIPNGLQRWGSAAFAVIGIAVFASYMTSENPSSFALGLGIGLILATFKLATGLRWL